MMYGGVLGRLCLNGKAQGSSATGQNTCSPSLRHTTSSFVFSAPKLPWQVSHDNIALAFGDSTTPWLLSRPLPGGGS